MITSKIWWEAEYDQFGHTSWWVCVDGKDEAEWRAIYDPSCTGRIRTTNDAGEQIGEIVMCERRKRTVKSRA